MGPLNGPNGRRIIEHGSWDIAFGNDLSNQPSNTLFCAVGPNDEADDVYGRIDLNRRRAQARTRVRAQARVEE